MFNTYYADFIEQGLNPIMSADAYKWICVFVAVVVVLGAVASPFLFQKYGPAKCAVFANILTAGAIVALLHIALARSFQQAHPLLYL